MTHTVKDLDRIARYLVLVIAGLLALLLILTVVVIATKPASGGKPDTPAADGTTAGTGSTVTPPANDPSDSVTLPETADAGMSYQDSLVFVGDSLTAHLASRGVLTGGTATKQVWRTESNMLNLNSEVTSAKIVLPGTGEKLTIAEAAAKVKPAILIITLGTDWGVAYLEEADFKAVYADLVRKVQKASPDTEIILQSIFPVTADCTLLANAKIDTANTWVKAVAAETGCRYLDTQSVLKGADNALKPEYCGSTDGIHLTKGAYEVILEYIRTHALS